MVATKSQEELVDVEMLGLVALTYGDEAVRGRPYLRQLVAYRPTIYPHIITPHTWKVVDYLSFEPTVVRIVRIVDVYFGFWNEVRKEKIKTSEEKRKKVRRGECICETSIV